MSHSNDVELREKEKKAPKEADIQQAESMLASESLHFSDALFSKMSFTSLALQGVREAGSSVVDSSGRSFVFSESSSFRDKAAAAASSSQSQEKPKKGKAKAFHLEDQLDSLDFRLKRKYDGVKKLIDDVVKEAEDFLGKEPEANLQKMSRVAQQLSNRLVVVKALGLEDDSVDLPHTFAMTVNSVPGLDEDERKDISQHIQENRHGLHYDAVNDLVEAVRLAADKPDNMRQAAVAELTQYVGILVESEFQVEGACPAELWEKETLESILKIHYWAGSGFSEEPDLIGLLADVKAFRYVMFARLVFDCTLLWFASVAKPILPDNQVAALKPLSSIVLHGRVNFRLQTSEDGLKIFEAKLKDEFELCKAVVAAAKTSFQLLGRQSRELRKESARLQQQADKERAAAENNARKTRNPGCDQWPTKCVALRNYLVFLLSAVHGSSQLRSSRTSRST